MRLRLSILAVSLATLATPLPAATMEQLRQVFNDPSLTDAQVISLAARKFEIPAEEIAREVGFTGDLNERSERSQSFAARASEKAVGGMVLGGAFGLLIALLGLGRYLMRRMGTAAKKPARAAATAYASAKSDASLQVAHPDSRAHDSLYAQALAELDSGTREASTWARALVVADGEESRARATYIKLRVAHLESLPP